MPGRPLACTTLDEKSNAILLAWHAGIEAGNAVYDCLFGEHSPCGKLPATFPRATGQIPCFYSRLSSSRERDVHIRYVDCDVSPLYPFGYGLSYADISYSDIAIENPKLFADNNLHASVIVANNSNVDTGEVVQVYFQDVVSKYATPEKKLCAFKKVYLPANGYLRVEFDIPCKQFSYMTPDLHEVVEPGEFKLYIGRDSDVTDFCSFEIIQ